jgi:hypothetical protein
MNREDSIPIAMAPPSAGICERCKRKCDPIWPLYYVRVDPVKDNMWEICTDCRNACGYQKTWKYAGGGDVVAIGDVLAWTPSD